MASAARRLGPRRTTDQGRQAMTSAEAPATGAGTLIGSDRVEGTKVHDPGGEHVGTISRLMIDRVSGRVAYVVATFAHEDLAGESFVIPWGRLSYDTGLGGYRTAITEAELRRAPRHASAPGDDESG